MSPIDYLVFAAAVPTMFAYLCRLDMLRYAVPAMPGMVLKVLRGRGRGRTGHQLAIILLHGCLAAACIFAGAAAWDGMAGPLEVFAVGGAGLWIVVSFSSWRKSVPAHFDSGPVPLDAAMSRPPA